MTIGTAGFLNVLSFLTGIMAARLLGPAGRGELAVIQLWGAFVATLSLIGLPEAVIFFTSRAPRRAGQYWVSGTCFALFTGLPILLLGYWALPWLLQAQTLTVVTTTRWYSIGLFVLFTLSWMPLSVFRSLQQVAEWNLLRLLPSLGWLLILGLGFVLHEASPRFLSYGFLATYAIMSMPILAVSVRKIPGPYSLKIQWWPSMVRYGLPLMLSLIPTYLSQKGRLSQLFLAAILGPRLLGFFTVAAGWASVSGIISQAIGQITFPRVASAAERTAQVSEIAKSTRFTVLSMLIICSILFVSAPVGIPLLFGKTFSPAVPVAMILVLAGGISGLKRVLSDSLRGLNKPKMVLVGDVVGIGITVLSLVILLQPLEITGAAIAILVGDSIATVLLMMMVKRAVGISASTLLTPIPPDFRALRAVLKKLIEQNKKL
ncbi:hypothetical protein ACVNPS_03975 [Candidatus Bipolaricaulota sp. J31]